MRDKKGYVWTISDFLMSASIKQLEKEVQCIGRYSSTVFVRQGMTPVVGVVRDSGNKNQSVSRCTRDILYTMEMRLETWFHTEGLSVYGFYG